MRYATLVFAMLLCLGLPPAAAMEFAEGPSGVDPFAAPEEEAVAVQQAAAAAKAWLAQVDAGVYAGSWKGASQLFRLALPQEQWERQLRASRAPMGELLARKRSSAQYTETLPGAPDGVYVVLQYATSFTRKSSAVETVTVQLENDGNWRVGGYYIR